MEKLPTTSRYVTIYGTVRELGWSQCHWSPKCYTSLFASSGCKNKLNGSESHSFEGDPHLSPLFSSDVDLVAVTVPASSFGKASSNSNRLSRAKSCPFGLASSKS